MLGLGVGSSLVGFWADRRYERAPDSLLGAYGVFELLIAALGLAVTLALPRLPALAASYALYVKDADGLFVLSTRSFVAQAVMAFVLLGPITLLMGGTLTLLIRHLVRADVDTAAGWKIAALYAVNTLGAAAGAFFTDFALVPAFGLRATLFTAVGLNVIAGVGALLLSRAPYVVSAFRRTDRRLAHRPGDGPPEGGHYVQTETAGSNETIVWTALALLLTGFAGMGLEIVWL